ncbi:MAG TPA: zinc-dependent metalloprotease [Candidatus Limnocylindrales bacterium]|nr:zinc-dependent metalloprotease [Candidatus Limnocylindrales bacterium]
MPQTDASRRLTRALAWGAALTLGTVVLRELVRPRPDERTRLIDWDEVEALALRRCGEAAEPRPDPTVLNAYRAIAQEVVPVLEAELGPGSRSGWAPAAIDPVGRRDWVRFNVRIFRQMLEPLRGLEAMLPASILLRLGRGGMTQYLGLMLGLLARRVLGQYDPALLGSEPVSGGDLILVEPNVQAWARKDSLPIDELRRWLSMHELTHAWQFRAHPWLQTYLEGLLREVLVGRLQEGRRPSVMELVRTLTVGVRQQWQAIAKLQAAMTVLEGFCNLVMDDVGRRQLPHFALLESAYRRRQEQRTALERAFLRITGLDVKMRQYVQGERFCRTVRESGGREFLDRVWEGPASLPTMAEISRPELWVARTRQVA